jgi:ubiquinone/menaquinone biosynthesis C-methylase UbiE
LLTVDFDRFQVTSGDRVLDMGCGGGRHAFALYRLGADVTAFDMNAAELKDVAAMFAEMRKAEEVPAGARARVVRGTAYDLPFADNSFDSVIAAEVLEHLPQDDRAMRELFRVLKPGGQIAVTVPRWGPELVCWALSSRYHEVEGGHVRIYRRRPSAGQGVPPAARLGPHEEAAPDPLGREGARPGGRQEPRGLPPQAGGGPCRCVTWPAW